MKFGLCAIDYDEIQEFFDRIGVPFHIIETPTIANLIRKHAEANTSACGLCSKMKKAILIDAAKDHGCNKVAMGHHMDDAIETLFMNMVHGGRLSVFKPKMYLDRSDI
jgi:tRNA(Ile)-lysidine synthase TilS/MesJ